MFHNRAAMATHSSFERRLSERHSLQLQIDLVLANGTILPIETSNISSTGLQFTCDSSVADEIEPRGLHNHPLDRHSVKVVGELPVDSSSKFYARCKIISARRLSQDTFLIGLGFVNFEGDGGKALNKLITEFERKKVIRKLNLGD
jgi:hypothetical protein